MKYLLLICALFLYSFSQAQITDTAQLNSYIRDNIRDKRPAKVTTEDIRGAMLGITKFLTPGATSGGGSGDSSLFTLKAGNRIHPKTGLLKFFDTDTLAKVWGTDTKYSNIFSLSDTISIAKIFASGDTDVSKGFFQSTHNSAQLGYKSLYDSDYSIANFGTPGFQFLRNSNSGQLNFMGYGNNYTFLLNNADQSYSRVMGASGVRESYTDEDGNNAQFNMDGEEVEIMLPGSIDGKFILRDNEGTDLFYVNNHGMVNLAGGIYQTGDKKMLTIQGGEVSVSALPNMLKVDTLKGMIDSALLVKNGEVNALGVRITAIEGKRNFYADQKAGNDDNDGRSINRPVKTISRLMALGVTDNDALWFKAGSYWREFLNLSTKKKISINVYGDGPKPIFDAADTAKNSSFTKTSGQANVYEIPWTNAFRGNTDVSAISVWENGQRLRRVFSLSSCNSNPGSYYASSVTQPAGTNTVYVHSLKSDSIPTNSRLYEIARRPMGVHVGDSCDVRNITTFRCGSNSGSFQAGLYSYIYGVAALEGVKHNFFMAGGLAENCMAYLYDSTWTGGYTAYVSFTDVANANTMEVVYKDCIGIASHNGRTGNIHPNAVGLYSHTSVSVYKSVSVIGGHWLYYGIGIDGEPLKQVVKDAFFYRNGQAISRQSNGSLEVDNCLFLNNNTCVQSNINTLRFTNNTFYGGSSNSKVIQGGFKNVTLTDNTIVVDAGAVNAQILYNVLNDTVNNVIKRNIFVGGTSNTVVATFAAPIGKVNLIADSNKVRSMSYGFNLAASPDFKLLAAMRALGYEINGSSGIPSSIIQGDKYTGDYYISKNDTLYGKAGSAFSFDSVSKRFPYHLLNAQGSVIAFKGDPLEAINPTQTLITKNITPINKSITELSDALSTHKHSGSDITSGTVPPARLPLASDQSAGIISINQFNRLLTTQFINSATGTVNINVNNGGKMRISVDEAEAITLAFSNLLNGDVVDIFMTIATGMTEVIFPSGSILKGMGAESSVVLAAGKYRISLVNYDTTNYWFDIIEYQP